MSRLRDTAHGLVRMRRAFEQELRSRDLKGRELALAIVAAAHDYAEACVGLIDDAGAGARSQVEMRTRRELCRALFGTDDLDEIGALCARDAA